MPHRSKLFVRCILLVLVLAGAGKLAAQEVRRAIPVNPPAEQRASPAPVSPVPSAPIPTPTPVGPAAPATPPLVAGSTTPSASVPASVNDTARFLAGMPVSQDSPLLPLTQTAAWQQHAAFFDQAWAKLEARQLTGIRDWESDYLPSATQPMPVVFYFLSGPDFLYANQFFPNAGTYVLAGTEPIGSLPDVSRFAPVLDPVLQNLEKSLNSVLSFSFFITKEMKTDLEHQELRGTLPILYVFLARAGRTITDISFVTLDKNGTPRAVAVGEKSAALTPGVRITFTAEEGAPPQTLYYFTTDLSNDGIRSKPGFLNFCKSLGNGDSLLKSASYLMFENGFTKAREFLLAHSNTVVEDDSGIPIGAFNPAQWALRFFGSYGGPIQIFAKYFQPQLQALYRQSNPPALPFGIGYHWSPRESTLIVAQRKASEESSPAESPAAED